MINSYKDLIVWQKSIKLTEQIYNITNKFPEREKFCLSNQMRRAAVSIPSNIAEGKARVSRKDFVQYLRIANGSACELETQLIIAKDIYTGINFLEAEDIIIE